MAETTRITTTHSRPTPASDQRRAARSRAGIEGALPPPITP